MIKCKNIRPTWNEYFFSIMEAVATRSTCDRGKVGCVIVRDHRILSTGYAGAPPGLPHCDDVGHLMETRATLGNPKGSTHCVRTTHAELNAILYAAKYGISLDGSTLYCKMTPCYNCAMAIIACGIKKVIVKNFYHAGKRSIEMFAKVGIEYTQLNDSLTY